MKTGGSYPSLLRGVSQQPADVRQGGQHAEQINMMPDPVEGLTRRRGSVYENFLQLGTPTTEERKVAMLLGAGCYKAHRHISNGWDYLILFRERDVESVVDLALPGVLTNQLPPVVVYNMTMNRFVPQHPTDAPTNDQAKGISWNGVGPVVSIGRFVAYSHKGHAGASFNPSVGQNIGNYPIVWIRGGAYTRTYSVKVEGYGTAFVTTPDAGLAGAAEAISPQNIANAMATQLSALGVAPAVIGSHIFINALGANLTVTDGGDGSLISGMGQVVSDVSELTIMAYNASVVQVGSNPETCFYVKAFNVDLSASPFGKTVWRESSSGGMPAASAGLALLAIKSDDTYFSLGGVTAGTFPLEPNAPKLVEPAAGNVFTNPYPAFMQKGLKITYLGMFQDRLLVGAGSFLAVSGAGDYFNFFRSSVVTVNQKDGFEMSAQGGEDDILRCGVPYNKNLVIFGDKRQYIISGQVALTPTSPNMSVMTTYENAGEVAPIAAGGQIYYARNREGSVDVHQIQPGAYVDSAESFPSSAQVSTYIPSVATQMEGVAAAPSHILVRSKPTQDGLHLFTYLDQPDGRKQDAWHRWKFDAACGKLMGVASAPDGVQLIWLRVSGNDWRFVADRVPMHVGEGATPWLDSQRTYSSFVSNAREVDDNPTPWDVAYDKTSVRYLIGDDLANVAPLLAQYPTETSKLWLGLPFESSVTLTNPYTHDGEGKAILSGRLVIGRLLVKLKKTAALVAELVHGSTTLTRVFNGRILGSPVNQIGKVAVTDADHSVGVGRETREYTMTLKSKLWHPLTITGIEWIGQSFNRTPRSS